MPHRLPLLVICGLLGCPLLFAAPPEPNLSPEGVGALSRFLASAVERGETPGVVALVVAPDRVLYHEAFGKQQVSPPLPLQRDAIFRIASMTKPITSLAVMMLIEEGKLGLDDEVSRYLPGLAHLRVVSRLDPAAGTWETLPVRRPITIRHLLTNTSGIGYVWSDPALARIRQQTGELSETKLPLVHEPGERWTYGPNTKVLGDVIEHLSGKPLDEFLRARLFEPLGMQDTWYVVPDAQAARVVTTHQKTDGRFVESPNPAKLSDTVRGDNGLFSTAADYGRFVQLILNRGEYAGRRLVREDTLGEFLRPQTGDLRVRLQPTEVPNLAKPFPLGADLDRWSFGFQVAAPADGSANRRRPGSVSWAGVYNTFFWIDPTERIGGMLLMQWLPFYDEQALNLLRGFEARVYEHLVSQAR